MWTFSIKQKIETENETAIGLLNMQYKFPWL